MARSLRLLVAWLGLSGDPEADEVRRGPRWRELLFVVVFGGGALASVLRFVDNPLVCWENLTIVLVLALVAVNLIPLRRLFGLPTEPLGPGPAERRA